MKDRSDDPSHHINGTLSCSFLRYQEACLPTQSRTKLSQGRTLVGGWVGRRDSCPPEILRLKNNIKFKYFFVQKIVTNMFIKKYCPPPPPPHDFYQGATLLCLFCLSLYTCLSNIMVSIYYAISFQPVLHDWFNKGRGKCYPVCGMVHIKEPLLLIGKSRPCCGSGFSF